MKASDIPDLDILAAIVKINDGGGPRKWALTMDLNEKFLPFPPKVIRAKAGQLIKRGLISGCDCGCRGDFEITTAGRAFIAEWTT